ncbi:histone acetyltransferases subunit 3-domain-containing protein [Syncephalis fuscata]|nr:histone acetyltransferases subunit 3-domain-containing protein [Syncephalis fuscata]
MASSNFNQFPPQPFALDEDRSSLNKLLARLSLSTDIDGENSLSSFGTTTLPSVQELRQLHDELNTIANVAEERLDRLRNDTERFKKLNEERSLPKTPTKQHATVKVDTIVTGRSNSGINNDNKDEHKGDIGASNNNDAINAGSTSARRQSIKPTNSEQNIEPRRRRTDRETSDVVVKEEKPEIVLNLRGTEKRTSKKGRSNQIKKGSGSTSKAHSEDRKEGNQKHASPSAVNARRNREQQQQQQQQQQQEEEYTRPKISNQVPIHVFWNSLEAYFRPLIDADLRFLEEKDDDVGPYLIPLLGRHYLQVWAEEDRALIPDLERDKNDSKPDRSLPAGGQPEQMLSDDLLEIDALSCGPLTERIIGALLRNDVGIPADFGRDVDIMRPSKLQTDLISVEERLKRELMHLGLLDTEGIDWQAAEDDEICGELRSLQRELREVEATNTQRKRKLVNIVQDYIGCQEYQQILDELDRHVEQSFARRHRVKKTKRKKLGGPKAGLSDTAVSALDRRRRFVDSIGRIFTSDRFSIPEKSIFS